MSGPLVDNVLSHFFAWKYSPPTDSDFISTQYGNIHTKTFGNSLHPAVLLIPDPPNLFVHFKQLIEELLNQSFFVICMDAPGFGFSTINWSFNFSIHHVSQTIIEVITYYHSQKNIKLPLVAAVTCVAGFPGLKAARDRPDLIGGLVLGQTASVSEQQKWINTCDSTGSLRQAAMGQLYMWFKYKQVATGWYQGALPKGAEISEFLKPSIEGLDHGAFFCLASAFQTLYAEDALKMDKVLKGELSNRKKLYFAILWGKADRTHKKTDKKSICQYINEQDEMVLFKELDNCGHFVDLEQVQEFTHAVKLVHQKVVSKVVSKL